ncbi:ATP-binding cassette sub-family C member Sur isoform X2 [Periplaneta americana]|uniref:ATP-binding cassette sub-family C member Sur isoform X2 n=1 Tax=Periplaneta americana TaxID=6978 RepID=UPI0037E8554E
MDWFCATAFNETRVTKYSWSSEKDRCNVDVVNITVAVCSVFVALLANVFLRENGWRWRGTCAVRECLSLVLAAALLAELGDALLARWVPHVLLTPAASLLCWAVWLPLHRASDHWSLRTLGSCTWFANGACRFLRLAQLLNLDLNLTHMRPFAAACVGTLCFAMAFVDVYSICCTICNRKWKWEVPCSTDSPETQESYKYATVNLYSKATFFWLTPLLRVGYTNPLELEDLGKLPEEEKTERQFKKFESVYNSERKRVAEGRSNKVSLWRCYFRSCWKMFALGGLFKLMGDCVGFVGPLGIAIVISHVSASTTDEEMDFPTMFEFLHNGYIMGTIIFVAALAQGTFSQSSTHLVNVEGIHLKVALQAMVYDKALRLCVWNIDDHREDLTSRHEEEGINKGHNLPSLRTPVQNGCAPGQNKTVLSTDMGTITNLMSEDAYNVMSFFWIGHYVWAIPLKIGLLMYLLFQKLGTSAIIGAAFCILTMTPLQFLIGKKMSTNSKAITNASDERLSRMNEVLQGIRLLKLYGWEFLYGQRILQTRAKELKLLDKDSLYWALMTFLTHASSVLVTLVTFGVYFLLEEKPLTPENVFSGLALFNQLTVPLFIFPITVPIIINAMVSTRRLENFLELPETCSAFLASSDIDEQPETEELDKTIVAVLENYSEGIVVNNSDIEIIGKPRTERADSVFGLGDIMEQDAEDASLYEVEEEVEEEEEEEEEEEVDCSGSLEPSIDVAITMLEGSFSWRADTAKPTLNTCNIIIPSGKLTLIVGRVGSGKTSLLSAFLGEMHKLHGTVTWASGSSVGYATQKPWLLNATLRENILFGQPFRPRRYKRVIAACSLEPDIDILPGKDLTEIGEKGINLSGGQKQRVAVARALYSQASVVIMDDPLSALDYQVGQKLFESGIRRLLLRQKRTVIFVTHRLQLLAHAHQIIALEDGTVRAQGTLAEIESNDGELVRTWRAAMSREALEEKRNARSEAARERWQLLKLVSRIGVQLKQRNITDGTWQTDEEAHVAPPAFLPLRQRRGTFSGSRYFTHDLPLPTDECEDEFLEQIERTGSGSGRSSLRHRSRAATTTEAPNIRHRGILRACSLQAGRTTVHSDTQNTHPSSIMRQYSSPSMQNSPHSADINCRSRAYTGVDNTGQSGSLLRRIFSVQSQRSNNAAAVSMSDHEQLRRLPSTASGMSDDMNDDDDPYDEVADAHAGCLTSEEEREYGKIPKRIYLEYLWACSTCIGTTYLVSAIAWQGLRVYTDYWLNQWTDSGGRVTSNTTTPYTSETEVTNYLLVYGILSLASIMLSLSSNGIGQYAGARARRVLHDHMLHNILQCPVRFFEYTPIGRIINRFSTDMSVIDKKIATSIQRLLQFLLLCFSAILINAVVTPWFLIAAVPICIVYFVTQRFYRCSSRELQRLDSIARSPIFSHFSETLGGLTTIRAFGHQRRFRNLLFSKTDAHTNAFLIMNTSNRWLGIALDYLGGVIVFISVVAALVTSRLNPDVTASLVGLAVNYTLLVPIYLNWVVKFLADMEMYMGAVERVQQYSSTPSEDYRLQGITVSKAWPQTGDIVFDGVSLRYDESREPVVSNLSLHIPAGQKVGICGRTGSGKSSLVMSLFHMVDVFEGKILIDGIDTKLVPLQILRSRLSVIPQDVIMFSGTIRENLDPESLYTDAELWKSLELAQLKDVVSSLHGCLDAEVREGGGNLSAGERQLFCLARAILHDAACLVMDEATSSVDPATEKALLTAATRAFAGKTVITIAHRLPTILDCDRIIVLEAGRIMEDGTPSQLQHRSMGIFSSMLRASQEGGPFTK